MTYTRSRFGATIAGLPSDAVPTRISSSDSSLLFTTPQGYARLDLGGWFNINRHVTAYANVNNALNNHYNEVLGYPALKANFRAGLRFTLGGE